MTAGTTAPIPGAAAALVAETVSVSTSETPPESPILAYTPRYVIGGPSHPGVIIEPPGLANVEPPPITYRPHLPKELCTDEKLSAMQFERIIYAGQAHGQRLADGSRAGISIGDGTGSGKTATLAGIVLDNWFQGRRRAVWFSVKADLIEAVADEFGRLGLTPPIKLINDFPTDGDIEIGDGIVFCTYRSLIARSKSGNRRIDQLTRWLGSEGVVIFDEGHKAKYAFADDRGHSTQTGAAVLEIQNPEKYPDYRIVYSSATSAGEVRHLAYMSRLGLWGEGTNFPRGFEQFAEEIESGGVGALEMVCRDLKAMGRYLCGNLSMGTDPESGLAVEFREVTHWLTPAQRTMYDSMARGWQEVFRNIHKALDLTNSGKATRAQAVNQFWAEHQRCFRNLITAFKVPTLIHEIEDALGRRESIVVSITGTGESQTKKQIERAADQNEAIDSLDFSPRETLTRLVAQCFPTACFQERTNPYSGTIEYIPVLDTQGNQVESRAALALRAELLDKLSVLEVPEHPLDQLVNYFGVENVAEMTGRKKRLIRTSSGTLEYRARQLAGVPSKLINLHEKNAFQNGDKRIAIMSEVASTGDSLHAGEQVGNKQRRLHIAAELKWSADKQIQDFGRTHRTGQMFPPVYLLVFTELGGEKRFSATIARRLGNMGALTKGDRKAEKAGNLDKYNLESKEGRSALNVVLTGIMRGVEIEGIEDPKQALRDMGLVKTVDSVEQVPDSEKTTIAKQLHQKSPRARKEFVGVNCASFTAELLESELFGYEKGAFTGANAAKSGLFETADGGTIFLDEVAELSISLQSKLLKAVEEKQIRRVGGTRERPIDVRIISATSKDLYSMVLDGAFRADLYDRLNILQLETIPLRCQKERIRDLFIRQLNEEGAAMGRSDPFAIEEEALTAVELLEWRGNY